MAETRSVLRPLGSLLLLGATALGLYNVYADNADVRALAEKTACADRPCTTRITRESRSPLAQEFSFQTQLSERGKVQRGASVDVSCRRQFYLLGDYACTAQGALPP